MSRRVLLFMLLILLLVTAVPALAQTGDEARTYIARETRQVAIVILSVAIVVVTVVTAALTRVHKGAERALWATALVCAAVAQISTIVIWFMVAGRSPNEDRANEVLMFTQEQVDAVIAAQQQLADSRGGTLYVVPTGVFIQSLQFDNANNVTITGYVWQRYRLADLPADYTIGFVLPEGDTIDGEEAYRFEQGDETIIGWYINTTLRQTFDYSLFPFDRQDIWLRIWAKDFSYTTLLVPDFASYDAPWQPFALPGLEKDFVLERWELERTFFSTRFVTYSSTFGIPGYDPSVASPDFYFNVGVKRDVLDAFIGYLIPLFIVLLLAFGVQFIVTQDPDKMSFYGINTSAVMGYCASLFFIAVLSHINLRTQLNVSTVLYFEYFFFIVYVVLLLITINAVVFTVSDAVKVLEYKDNLIPKVLFLPVTMVLLFIVTAVLMYP